MMKLIGKTLAFSIIIVVGLLGASLTEAFPDDRSTIMDKDARPERLSATETSAPGYQQTSFALMAAKLIGALVEQELPGIKFKPSAWIRSAEKIVAALPVIAPDKVYTAIPAEKIVAALEEIPSEKIYDAIPAKIYKAIPATKIGPAMMVIGKDTSTLEPTISPISTTTSIPTTTTTSQPTTISPTITPTEGPTVETTTTSASTPIEPTSTTPPVTTSTTFEPTSTSTTVTTSASTTTTTTQVPTELPTSSPKKHHGLSKGEVAALVCFSLILIGTITGGIIYFVRKRRVASESYTRLVQ